MRVLFYDKLLELLKSYGVREIYGVPGDAINPLIDAIRRDRAVRFIHVNHEEGGAFAASAAAKLTGRLQVCVGTVGPGAIHLLNGLYDAKKDHAPVLAIAGQVPSQKIGSDYHQEVDLKALFADVANYLAELRNPEQLASDGLEACRYAIAEQSVSVLIVPHDAGAGSLDDFPIVPNPGQREASLVANPASLQTLADAIASTEAVTLMVGEGARESADAVILLAEHWKAPVIRSLRAKDIVPEESEWFAGGLGLLGDRGGVTAMAGAELVLVLGCDFPYSEWYNHDCRFFQVDKRSDLLGRRRPGTEGIHGDVETAVTWLLEHTAEKKETKHLGKAQTSRSRWEKLLDAKAAVDRSKNTVHPQAVARQLGVLAADDAIYTCDTGAVTVWGARHLKLRRGQRFSLSFNLASMAYALPAAIGAQIAYPERQVIALSGDGGFNMLMGELLTAVKYQLPIKVVVFNNQKLGLIQLEQEVEGLPESETDLQNPDYVALAESMGVSAWRIEKPGEIESVLRLALSAPGPVLVDAQIHPTELAWPPAVNLSQATGFGLSKIKELFEG